MLTGRPVRLACERHLRDLDDGPSRGLTFRPELAQVALDFFPTVLCLAEGEHAGKPFVLQPWQQYIIGSLFGWVGRDGHRRFRTAYIEAAKGQGKTPLLAGLGLYGLTCDDEPGAQVFTAAVTREQARIMFEDATKMAEASPTLAAELDITANNIAHLASGSFMRPVSSEGRSLDAKRVHMALIDEIHEHPSAVVVDKLRLGTKGRRQALVVEITNAGYDRHTVCWQHHEYSLKVLDRVIDDDSWFPYVCQLDPCEACRGAGKLAPTTDGCPSCDDWTDEATWPKANPNLDVSVTRKYLREVVREAVGMPSKRSIVERLNFCIWTESAARWFPADAWAACAASLRLEDLRGRRCIAGLDLSSTMDLTALVLLALGSEPVDVVSQFWVPAENLGARAARDRVPYPQWAAEGWLAATEGNVVDYDAILDHVTRLVDAHGIEIVELAYDPWNATAFVTRAQAAGITCVPIRQGFASLSAPSKELEKRVAARTLRHDGNPVMAWCVASAVVETDPAGNIKPSKAKSTERIDGVVALVTALARAIVQPDTRSVYETRGPLVIGERRDMEAEGAAAR